MARLTALALGEPSARAFLQDLADGFYAHQPVDLTDIQAAMAITPFPLKK